MKVSRTPALLAGLAALGCASHGTHPNPAPQPAAFPASQMATSAAAPSPVAVLRTTIDSLVADPSSATRSAACSSWIRITATRCIRSMRASCSCPLRT